MQSVLSAQAARAGKATEKINGRKNSLQSRVEQMQPCPGKGGRELSSWVSPGMEAKGFTFFDLLPAAVTVKLEQGLSLLCLPMLQRALASYSCSTLIFHKKSIYMKLQSPRRKIFISYTPSRSSTRDSLPWQHFAKSDFFSGWLLPGSMASMKALLWYSAYFISKKKPQQGRKWLCEISYNHLSKIKYPRYGQEKIVDISLDTRPLSILVPAGLSTWWPTILAPFCVREILPGIGLDSH